MNSFKLLLAFILIASFYSCKDDERTIDMNKLTLYNWYLKEMQLKIRNPISPKYNTDTLIFPDDCDTSDYRHFFSDSSYIDYNIGKCNLTEKETSTGKWSYIKSGSHIILTDENDEKGEFVIHELSGNWFIVIQEIRSVVVKNKKNYTLYSRKKYYYKGRKP